jgi:DNA-binding beta-propeller fold protein YncE
MQKTPFLLFTFVIVASAQAQLAVTANDNHWTLVNGVQVAAKNPAPDCVSIIDLSASPPKLVAEVDNVPASVIGPPLSVAVTPDESLALVTACMKIDPADPTKQTEDNRVTVIDLKATPPKVIATLEAGKGPAGISVNRAGTLALVANRGDGSVSIFTINGKTVSSAGKIDIGNAASALGHVAFSPDGKRALVTRDGDNMLTLLNIDGTKVTLAGRDIRTGLRPYPVDFARDGSIAVTSNVGPGNGDADTLGVIDMRANPPRTVDVVLTGQTPEGGKLSSDGKLFAAILQNGSNKPKDSPFYNDFGLLVLFKVNGMKLTKAAEAKIGHWPQGVAFSNDGQTIVATNMVEKDLQVFHWDGTSLKDAGQHIKLKGAPAAIRTAEK